MDDWHYPRDEPIISYALRLRLLPVGHPQRLTIEEFEMVANAGIQAMRERAAANVALLIAAGLKNTLLQPSSSTDGEQSD